MNVHINTSVKGRFRKNEQFAWTPENTAFAADLWARGYTSTHIAKQLGISRSSFSGMASRNKEMFPPKTASGIPQTRKGNKWTKHKLAECVRLRRLGKTMQAISEILEMPKSAVDHVIRKNRALFEVEQPTPQEVTAEPRQVRRSFIAGRWVARVPYTTFAGAIVSLPHVSMINGPEA